MSVVAAVQGQYQLPSSDSNELYNSLYNQDNYPVWTSYNGVQFGESTIRNVGVFKGFAGWLHYSPLFNQGYSSYIGNQMMRRVANHNGLDVGTLRVGRNSLASYLEGYAPRILKIYGAENLWAGMNSVNNNNADRGAGQEGELNNQNHTRIVSNTTRGEGSLNSGTAMSHTGMWTRSTEWSQVVDIPDNVTSIKFGAQIRILDDDKLRPLNWAGIYCAEDNYSTDKRTVNYFGIRHTDATFNLPTGTLTGSTANYNWSGLSTTARAGGIYFFTPAITAVTEHAMLDQDDFEEFSKVEYTFTPQSGTNRRMSLNIFFAESTQYLAAGAGEYTGGFEVFDSFLEFST